MMSIKRYVLLVSVMFTAMMPQKTKAITLTVPEVCLGSLVLATPALVASLVTLSSNAPKVDPLAAQDDASLKRENKWKTSLKIYVVTAILMGLVLTPISGVLE